MDCLYKGMRAVTVVQPGWCNSTSKSLDMSQEKEFLLKTLRFPRIIIWSSERLCLSLWIWCQSWTTLNAGLSECSSLTLATWRGVLVGHHCRHGAEKEHIQPWLYDTAKQRTKRIWLNNIIQKERAHISEDLNYSIRRCSWHELLAWRLMQNVIQHK